jgi:hypothetical protein
VSSVAGKIVARMRASSRSFALGAGALGPLQPSCGQPAELNSSAPGSAAPRLHWQ